MKLVLLVLAVCLASPALAEIRNDRMSQGNNVGLNVTTKTLPLDGISQFPRGSGNYIPTYEGTWGYTAAVVRDLNADGVPEDTAYSSGRGRETNGGRGTLEAYDVLQSLYNAGENMEQASNRLEANRVWTSLDADDLASWPQEFRAGRSPSGDPVLIGNETMVTFCTGAFRTSTNQQNVPIGISLEYAFYFLDYKENNNMVYGHLFVRNMSEYLKWNPNPDFAAGVSAVPDGVAWDGLCLIYVTNYFGIGSDAVSMDEGWALHPAKGIACVVDQNGVDDLSPTYAFMVGHKMLRYPSYHDETMEFTNQNNMRWHAEFGFDQAKDLLLLERGMVYRALLGQAEDLYPGMTNPFNNKPAMGFPGMLDPEDARYEQWLWGSGGRMCYSCYSELHDIAPRDTTSCDYVLMFVYPKSPPMAMPAREIGNIDDPVMQDQFIPMELHAAVADLALQTGFSFPETPKPPPLTIIPGDRQVTITWSNVNINTQDNFYYKLHELEADPEGIYRKYDFEGYRLYRSFVGPSDSHSELVDSCSISDGNIHFYFVDRWDDDDPYYRLRNGLKVWYALVPYDKNCDPATGEEFSLPFEGSGKTWNRPGEGLYTVVPRSDASNFRSASFNGVTYVGPATVDAESLELAGDGNGKLTEPPQFLQPRLDFSVTTINDEKLKEDVSAYIACTDLDIIYYFCNWNHRKVELALVDGGGTPMVDPMSFDARDNAHLAFNDKPDYFGVSYVVEVDYSFNPMIYQLEAENKIWSSYADMDPGGYTGGTVAFAAASGPLGCTGPSAAFGINPGNRAWVRTGIWEITWKSAGDDLSVEVVDVMRGETVPFGTYTDDNGKVCWGFMASGSYGGFYSDIKNGVPREERANQMFDKIPASNTDEFAIWVNAVPWTFTDITSMPASGTKMTLTVCLGFWNDDMTVFTQVPDPPCPGDKWQINIKPMTMNPEDADLKKIRVVPNPYIGTSVLDMSPLSRRIEFVNLPDQCTIRIYSLGGNLVNVLNHTGRNRFGWGNYTDWDRLDQQSNPRIFVGFDNHSGTEPWNLQNRFGQTVASGLYFFHVTDARGETYTGKFYIIN
ncbi:MAG: hypothetical protein JXQ83_06565 [Candidatus Glassbacteria bacterium]|nr:hypothetical protein [Candidatus Glassbacteria bacterium]